MRRVVKEKLLSLLITRSSDPLFCNVTDPLSPDTEPPTLLRSMVAVGVGVFVGVAVLVATGNSVEVGVGVAVAVGRGTSHLIEKRPGELCVMRRAQELALITADCFARK